MDNPTTYYKLLQVSKIFKLDTDMMKAKFIRKTNDKYGSINYKLPNGWLHSCYDHCSESTKPAIILTDGTQSWYYDGNKHRDNDQPAIIYTNGSQFWYINGKQHRDDNKPAKIWADGTQFWYINDAYHHDNFSAIR